MSVEQIQSFIAAVANKNWPLVMAVVIGLLVMIGKSEKFGGVINKIPRDYRAAVPVALGILSGISDALFRGSEWTTALLYGVLSGLIPIGADQTMDVVKTARQDVKAGDDKPVE